MRRLHIKKIIACVAVITQILCSVTALSAGDEYIYSETVSPGLKYTKTSSSDGSTVENTFVFEYTPGSDTKLKFLHGSYIYGFSTLGKMIESEKKTFENSENVVGGINGDFFSMKTGVPMSAIVSDGELISTDDSRPALGITSDNTAFIDVPNFKVGFIGDNFSYSVGHINKYPTPYSVYLLTDKFNTSTKTDYPSTEIVLMPVNEEYSEDKYTEFMNRQSETVEIPEDENPDSQGDNVSFSFDDYYKEARITPECKIDTVVIEVRESTKDGKIPKGCFVLTADDRPYKEIFSAVAVGQRYTLEVECNEAWQNVTDAIGGGALIVENGKVVDVGNDALYTARHPRSAVGIKADGKVVFCAVDGRRAGYSNGMTARELSEYMISLGCDYALNLDGGGSTTVYAALPGDGEKLVNRPTDGTQRGISTAAVFVNCAEGDGEIFGMRMNLSDFYVLGGGSRVELPEILYTYDFAYKPLGAVNVSDGILLTADDFGTVVGEYFVSPDASGTASLIFSVMNENGSTQDYRVADIHVTNSPDILTLSPEDKTVGRGHYTTLHISGTKNTLPVFMDTSTLWFSVNGGELSPLPYEDEYCKIDEKGDLTVSETCPVDSFEITVAAGTKSASAKINVKEDLFSDMRGHWARRVSEFAYNNGIMDGIMSDGKRLFKPDDVINTAQLSAMTARFLKVDSSKYSDYDFEENLGVSFAATDSTYWSKQYVAALANMGIIDCLYETDGDGEIISADRPITRIDAMRILGSLVSKYDEVEGDDAVVSDKTETVSTYSDMEVYMDDEYIDSISSAIDGGLFGGYPDGTLRPDIHLTRAQTAAVFMRLYS